MRELGNRIRKARENCGCSQERLAEYVGVSRTAVSRWENGDSEPKLRHLVGIAELFSVSSDALLGIEKRRATSLSQEAETALKQFIEAIRKDESDE